MCADITFGLRTRIEGWSTKPRAKEKEIRGEERRRQRKYLHHLITEEILFSAGLSEQVLVASILLPSIVGDDRSSRWSLSTRAETSQEEPPSRGQAKKAPEFDRPLPRSREDRGNYSPDGSVAVRRFIKAK